jgi:hypothetical protein
LSSMTAPVRGSARVRDHSALPGEEEDEEVERRQ